MGNLVYTLQTPAELDSTRYTVLCLLSFQGQTQDWVESILPWPPSSAGPNTRYSIYHITS